jgi:methylase of polypeptide subunit release factors
MEVIEKIIADSPAHLHTHGQLWLEHEPEQSALIATLASTHGFTCVTHTDQYEVERYSCLVLQ